MKIILIIIMLVLSIQTTYSKLEGQAKIDSLLEELPDAKLDTNKVNLLQQLSFAYFRINPDKGIKFGKQGLKLTLELKWDKGEANCYNSLGLNYETKSNYTKALEYYEKSLDIQEDIGNKIGIANALGNIGNIYQQKSNRIEALKYQIKSLNIHKEIDNKVGIVRELTNIGNIYSSQSDNNKAIEYYKRALNVANKIGGSTAGLLHNIGLIYKNQSNFQKALEYILKAKEMNEEASGNKVWLSINLDALGDLYKDQSNYPKALEYIQKSLKVNEELGNKSAVSSALKSIGLIYDFQSDFPKALEYYQKSLKLNEELGDKSAIAYSLIIIGNFYGSQSDIPKAIDYYQKSLKVSEESDNKFGIMLSLGTIGQTYLIQSNYPKALVNLQSTLDIFKELEDKEGIAMTLGRISEIYQAQSNYSKSLETMQKSLDIYQEIGDKYNYSLTLTSIGAIYLNLAQDSIINKSENKTQLILNKEVNINKSIDYYYRANLVFKEIGALNLLSNYSNTLSTVYEQKGDYKKAFESYKKYKELNDSIFSSENQTKIAKLEAKRENEVKQKEIEILKKDKENQKLQRYAMFGGIAGLGIIIGLILIQRRKSEKLLLNVLPAKIAKRLKAKEHPIADHFDSASIIFIDLVGFTKMSSSANPKEIVALLNDIFTLFDKLADKHGLEKIKTIGDAYMAVAGIPEIQTDHSKRAAKMALDIKQEMKDFKTSDGTEIKFRIGIDCGAVVAGVIGEKKFIYDLWSDAVNTASRMESTGEAGHIQITDNFKNELEKFEGNWNFTLRGEFEVKGKGLMKTYFLE